MAAPEEFASVQPASKVDDYYAWAPPGAPVQVHLRFGLVERLERELRGGRRLGSSHSVEIGGLLLGTVKRLVVEVKDFEPFLCEYRSDRKFILSESDRHKLEQRLAAHRPSNAGQLTVVGYYRSHIGERLSLSEPDLFITRSYFSDPASVVLLMKPSVDGSFSAGFFFWDNGRIESDLSFLEFPFDAEQLRRVRINPSGPDAPRRLAQSSAPREFAADVGNVTTGSIPAEERQEELLNRFFRWRSYWMAAITIIVLAVVGYSAYRRWAQWRNPAPDLADPSALALEVGRSENDLRVSWNRNSSALHHAKGAVLSIRDGGAQLQNLPLELEQLRNGSVLYTPANPRVQFRLEVTDGDGQKVSETVLALMGRGPGAAATTENRSSRPEFSRRHVSPPVSAQPATIASQKAADVAARPPQRNETPAAPRTRNNFDRPRPAQARNTRARTRAVEKQLISALEIAPSPANPPQQANSAVPTAPQTSAPTPEPVLPAAGYVAARPIHEERPTLSRVIRRTVTSAVEVQVRVRVDESGNVVRADPVASTGPVRGFLVSASRDAALHWRFLPAMRGNQPVASEMVLKFSYRPASAAY